MRSVAGVRVGYQNRVVLHAISILCGCDWGRQVTVFIPRAEAVSAP